MRICRQSQLRIPKNQGHQHNANLKWLKINLANSVSHFQFLFSEKSCTPSRYLWIGTIFCDSVKGVEHPQHFTILVYLHIYTSARAVGVYEYSKQHLILNM